MRCAKCGRDNPPEMRFCVYCGARLAIAEPSEVETAGVATQQAMPQQTLSPAYRTFEVVSVPAYRPFGIVFVTVYSIMSGLSWMVVSAYPIVGAMIASPFGAETSVIAGLATLSFVVEVLGILKLTGAIGLWLLTKWGRNLTAGVQVFDIILGIIMLIATASEEVQKMHLTGLLTLAGLFTIGASIAIMFYLLRTEMDVWFRKA